MTGWLLDTNVISELKKPTPNPDVLTWVGALARTALHTSSVNLAEIRFGIVAQAEPVRRQGLQAWLDELVRPLFDDRVLEATEDALLQWRILVDRADRNRQPSPSADLLIAAIATVNSLPVATRDVAPFVSAGIPVLSPWTGERFNGA